MKLTNVGHIEISVKRAKTEPFVFWCLYYLFKHSSSHKKVKEGGGYRNYDRAGVRQNQSIFYCCKKLTIVQVSNILFIHER